MAFLALAMGVCASAQVVDFTGYIETGSADEAKESFEGSFTATNCNVVGKTSSNGNGYVELVQVSGIQAWSEDGLFAFSLDSHPEIRFEGKDKDNNKTLYKVYNDYIQPNGGGARVVVKGLNPGDKVKILFNGTYDAVNVEGLSTSTVTIDATEKEFTIAEGSQFVMYSKGTSTVKWQIKAITITKNASAIKGINADSLPAGKSAKTIEDGKVIIIRDGVKYNMNGSIIK